MCAHHLVRGFEGQFVVGNTMFEWWKILSSNYFGVPPEETGRVHPDPRRA